MEMISLDRTITGYMKGNYNETTDQYEMHNRSNTSSWKNFHWKSKHSAVSITSQKNLSQNKFLIQKVQ